MQFNPPKILPIEIVIDKEIKKIYKNAHAVWTRTKHGFRIKIRSDY